MGKVYFKLLTAVYFLALIICGAARTLLVLGFIDHHTGFYTVDTGIIPLFNLCFVAAVLFFFISNRLRRVGNDYPVQQQSVISGLLCILTGLSILAFVLLDSPYPLMEQGYSATLIQFRDLLSVVLGALAALSFVLFGVGSITGNIGRAAVIPGLFACLWQVFMLVTRFNSYTTLTTISDNLMAVLFMVFSSLFLIGHARTILGFSRKNGRNYTIPAGLSTSLCGLLLVVPNYACMLLQGISMPAPQLGIWESVSILIMSIYALVFVLGMMRSIKTV